jgi:hypothetical protein
VDKQSYAFANVREMQRERLRTLEALLDAGTIQHLERLREPLITSGRVTTTEVDEVVAPSGDPRFRVQSPITMAARGRRPDVAATATSAGS